MIGNKKIKSRISIEKLWHFSCDACKKWWTVGDAPKGKKVWHCPWCGTKQIFIS